MEQQPTSSHTPPPPPRQTGMQVPATLPIPGNAEFLLYVVVVVVFAIIWLASDLFEVTGFVTATTILTAAYFLSRGIAKASRVYEQ